MSDCIRFYTKVAKTEIEMVLKLTLNFRKCSERDMSAVYNVNHN